EHQVIRRRRAGILIWRAPELGLKREDALLADVEIDIHRIHRVERGQQRAVGRDKPSHLDLGATHYAIDWRFDAGVAEVELGGLDVRLRRLDRGAPGTASGQRGIVILTADGIDFEQRLYPLEVAVGLLAGSLCLRQFGPGLRQRDDIGLRINLEQRLPLLDGGAVRRQLLLQYAADAWPQLDGTVRLGARNVALGDGGAAWLQAQRRHFDRRGRRRRVGAGRQ